MKVQIDDGLRVSFPLAELLEWLSLEDKITVADSLACFDDVIKYVGQQITDRWTEHGSYGYRGDLLSQHETPLDRVTREVAMKSSDIAKKQIEGLRIAIDKQCEIIHALRTKNQAQLEDLERLRSRTEAAGA